MREKGEPVSALDQRPTLGTDLHLYWNAFFVLHRSRPSNGFGWNPISISEIASYLMLVAESDPDERRRYVYFIQELDQEFQKSMNKKAGEKQPKMALGKKKG